MIELTNSEAQSLVSGQPVSFDKKVLFRGCEEHFDFRSPTSVKLTVPGGIYIVSFSGNIATPSTTSSGIQMCLALGEARLPETVMVVSPTPSRSFFNVATTTYICNNCCDNDRISVLSIWDGRTILSANMNLRIRCVGKMGA